MIKIITDSASDITQQEGLKLGIEIIPLTTIFSDGEYKDGVTITHEGFYQKLIETNEFPKTSQITPYEYSRVFEKYKDDEIIVITLSKKLSGCYQSAHIASQEYDNVHIIDSENVAIGEQIIVRYALELLNSGMEATRIVETLEEAKKHICVIALLDTLEYLKKGGRISQAKAMIGTMLAIKPVCSVENGKIELIGKARGSKNGQNLLRKIITDKGAIDYTKPYCVAYTGLSDALVKKYLLDSKDLYKVKPEEVPIRTIGSTIGTHVGPGAIAVAYFKKLN